tara:strand:- start:11850 stop:13886 length:2037 start_codon:yes stop_codon:yes gene_type:complete
MNILDLLNAVSTADATGRKSIKPLKSLDLKKIGDVIIGQSESHHLTKHGAILFKDKVWHLSGNSINFESLSQGFELELKSHAVVSLFEGGFEGSQGVKPSTVRTGLSFPLNFSKYLMKKNINSFSEFNKLEEIKRTNVFKDFAESSIISPRSMFAFLNSDLNGSHGLLTTETSELCLSILDSLGIKNEFKNSLSHPVIPTEVMKTLLKQCSQFIKSAEGAIDDWEACNDALLTELLNFNFRTKNKVTQLSKLFGPACLESRKQLKTYYEYLDNLKLYVFIYVLAYTGMRYSEASSCELDCAVTLDGQHYIEAWLKKTDDSKVKMKWVTNKDTYDAVLLLSRYVKGMHKRAEVLLENYKDKLSKSVIHSLELGLKQNLLFGVRDTLGSISFCDGKLSKSRIEAGKLSKFTLDNINIAVTLEDIDELENLGCNIKSVRGSKRGIRYHVGDYFHFTPHKFRHTFAYFIIANRLGSLDDIKHQFKHLARAMTLVYSARGYASTDELIGMFEDYEDLLVDILMDELVEQANRGELKGHGGQRLNNAAKELIFKVENSSGSSRTIQQIHFKDLNEYKDFLKKNLHNIRGLPHGYCTGGDDCKLKSVGIPEGCVYCSSYVVDEKSVVQWEAIKNFAQGKLDIYNQLSDSEKEDYSIMALSWQNSIDAANLILSDKKPLRVEGESA